VRELAIYEKAEHEVKATPDHVRRTLFCANPAVFGLICEIEGKAVGLYFFNYSTWQPPRSVSGRPVHHSRRTRPRRRQGLLQHLARIALEKDCGRFEWSCLDGNTPSIKFMTAWALCRRPSGSLSHDGPGLQAMATGDKQA
jgi:hypothetical protein